MEITYENEKTETCAITINLTDEGQFEAEVVPYEISDSDNFVLDPETENVPAYGSEESRESADTDSDEGSIGVTEKSLNGTTVTDEESADWESKLSEADLEKITEAAEKYYTDLPYKVSTFTPDYKETERQKNEYNGYNPDEILVLRMTVKGDEVPRFITIGSKDGWNHCRVLNEGY